MLSQQELSDRFEIQDLLVHYAALIDARRFDDLCQVFTTDAYIDYSALGGSVGDLEATISFLKASLTRELFPASQHLNANMEVKLDGDRAAGRVMCLNPLVMALPDSVSQTFFLGLWYVDEYRRTEEGWRISRRQEEKSWVFNAPAFMTF